jgi:CheY-like chemotaxis protein
LDSKVGAGSTFEIYLPIVEKKLTKDEIAPSATVTEGSGRILLVDDEPLITSVGSELLGEAGYQVQAVNHPREALKLIEADPAGFDLIITDLTMPEFTGIEMMQKIRTLHSATPAILISGYNERIKPEEAKACGITQILSKPCPAATLLDAVRKAMSEASGGVQ